MRKLTLSVAAGALWLSGAAALAAVETAIDFGQAPAATIDTFEIDARNQSCDEPQNFRFATRGLPWLKLVNGSVVRGVERGKSKRFVAQVDLRGLKPGRYNGRLDVICETCGDFVASRCQIDLQSIALSVEVVPG
jgi:hypothetical protein